MHRSPPHASEIHAAQVAPTIAGSTRRTYINEPTTLTLMVEFHQRNNVCTLLKFTWFAYVDGFTPNVQSWLRKARQVAY